MEEKLSTLEEKLELILEEKAGQDAFNPIEMEMELSEEIKTRTTAIAVKIDKELDAIKQVVATNSTKTEESTRANLDSTNTTISGLRVELEKKITDVESQISRSSPAANAALQAKISEVIASAFKTTDTTMADMKQRIVAVEEKLGRAASLNLVELKARIQDVVDSTATTKDTALVEMEKLEKRILAIEENGAKFSSSDSLNAESKPVENHESTTATTAGEGAELEKRIIALEETSTLVEGIRTAVNLQAARTNELSEYATRTGHSLNNLFTTLVQQDHRIKAAADFAQLEKAAIDDAINQHTASIAMLITRTKKTDDIATYQHNRLRTKIEEGDKVLGGKLGKLEMIVTGLAGTLEKGGYAVVKGEQDSDSFSLSPNDSPAPPALNRLDSSTSTQLPVPPTSTSHSCPLQSTVDDLRTSFDEFRQLAVFPPCQHTSTIAGHATQLNELTRIFRQPLGSQPGFSRLASRVDHIEKVLKETDRDIASNMEDVLDRLGRAEDRTEKTLKTFRIRLDEFQPKTQDPRTPAV